MDKNTKNKSYLNTLINRFRRSTAKESNVEAALTYQQEILKDWALYRSQPRELMQVFGELGDIYPQSFWSNAKFTDSIVPRTLKLPKDMVDRMTEICGNAIHEITFDNKEYQKIWEEIIKDCDFKEEILLPSIRGTEVTGDVCVVTFADGKTPLPFNKIYIGDQFTPIWEHNKFVGAKVFDIYFKEENNKKEPYMLETYLQYGSVSYKLFNKDGEEVPLTTLEETKTLVDFTHDKTICFANVLRFRKSEVFEGRGESIYYGRETAFDALDEVYSVWNSAPSINSTKVFNGEDTIERDRLGREIKRKRLFNFFRSLSDSNSQFSMGDNRKQLEVYNPTWSVQNFVETHYTNIEECLKNYMSPSTLSYNVQKFSTQTNASYNAQIEKATTNTRSSILEKLTPFLQKIIRNSVYMYCVQVGKEFKDFEIMIDYCEFETPSIEQKTDVFSKQVASGLCSRKYAMQCINPDLDEEKINKMYLEYLQEQKDLANLVDFGNEEEFEKEEQVEVKKE